MKVGDSFIVTEKTNDGEFKWDGVITQICEAFIETKHRRNRDTHPQWANYHRAYEETFTKHYKTPNK